MTAIAVGCFDDEGAFMRARTKAIAAERRILGEWTPYAPIVLQEGRGAEGMLAATLIGGFGGGIALFALESWSAVWAYPFNSGGRAYWSWPAFLPAAVEFAALTAAIVGLGWLFRQAGLTRLHHAAFAIDEVGHASQGAFVLALGCDAGEDGNAALALLAEAGAGHSRLINDP